jgi:hypothetical protein
MLAVAGLGIALVQPGLARAITKVRLTDDITALPPPPQLRAMTFGYRAAAADVLWASLVVEYGLHSEEHRPFHGIRQYLDGILELVPDHPSLYRFVDTFLIYRPGEIASDEDVRAARMYLERGTKELPFDADVWLHYGQFIAFLAPTFLKDPNEIERWRTDGAFALARSIELGSNPDRTLTVATLLNQAGNRKAAIQQLQRHYALTEDPATRRQILLDLQRFQGSAAVEESVETVESQWHTLYPFLTKSGALLVGPDRDPAACAGPSSHQRRACAADWTAATAGEP